MIIQLNIKKEKTYYKIFEDIKIAFTKLNSNIQNTILKAINYIVLQQLMIL